MSAAVSTATDRQTAVVGNKCSSANSSVVTFNDDGDDVRIVSPVTAPHCDGRMFCSRKDSADVHVDFSLNLSDIDNDIDNEGNVEGLHPARHVADINKNTAPHCSESVCSGSGNSSANKRFLTAKYPKQRMGMVRRRIAVEDWIDSELRQLHNVGVDDTYDATVDLDELLEMSSDAERSQYVKEQLASGAIPEAELDTFLKELLVKVESLAY